MQPVSFLLFLAKDQYAQTSQLFNLYKSEKHKLLSSDSYISLLYTTGLTVLNKWLGLQLEKRGNIERAEVIV